MEALQRMARIVDQQNAGDPAYLPMSGHFKDSIAFAAACAWCSRGGNNPTGIRKGCCAPIASSARAPAGADKEPRRPARGTFFLADFARGALTFFVRPRETLSTFADTCEALRFFGRFARGRGAACGRSPSGDCQGADIRARGLARAPCHLTGR